MKNILHSLSAAIAGIRKKSPVRQRLITIGGQKFAVAHSREEMARLMRMRNQKVAGYVLQHRM